MKVLSITLHSIYNPGSALQAYALNAYLKKIGIDNEIIDYRPYYATIGKNKIKGFLRNILYYKNRSKIKDLYTRFMAEYMDLTPQKYTTFLALNDNPPQADIYITGSDQLWNIDYDCGRDEAYYLKFINGVKKVSYSTSVGKRYISEREQEYLKSNLSEFSNLAVREKSTSVLLSRIFEKPVQWVCDPVFLLEPDDYMKFVSDNKYGDYIVVYLSARSKKLDDLLEKLKEKTGYKIIQAGGHTKRCNADVLLPAIGPKEFISLIFHSKLVVCSSFHAIAFSHIFHKNFVCLLPEPNGERITSLLSLSGLESKIMNDVEKIEEYYKAPDYNYVENKLQPFIQASKDYLLKTCQID